MSALEQSIGNRSTHRDDLTALSYRNLGRSLFNSERHDEAHTVEPGVSHRVE